MHASFGTGTLEHEVTEPATTTISPSAKWVFLDRDGTINVSPPPHEYVTHAGQLALIPGAAEAIARLNAAGSWVGVVTNQRGLARGLMNEDDLEAVHARLRELLAQHGAYLDGIWVCPHGCGDCECRKPKPGLLLAAQAAVPDLELGRATMIGDSESDVAAGNAVGAATIRIGPERGRAGWRAEDLSAAVDLVLRGG
jgi:D-glycero-D-manno-heptose 1,7-bisphosphate phosphatase